MTVQRWSTHSSVLHCTAVGKCTAEYGQLCTAVYISVQKCTVSCVQQCTLVYSRVRSAVYSSVQQYREVYSQLATAVLDYCSCTESGEWTSHNIHQAELTGLDNGHCHFGIGPGMKVTNEHCTKPFVLSEVSK